MTNNQSQSKRGSLVIPALLVVVLVVTSSLLLLAGFVIWFAELINSITLALLICAVVLAAVAWVIYKVSLSPTLKQLQREYEQFISIISLLHSVYNCLVQKVRNILSY